MGTGVIIGIACGCAVVVAIIIVLLCLYCKGRGNSRKEVHSYRDSDTSANDINVTESAGTMAGEERL